MTDNSEKIRFWINGEALFTEPGTTVSSLLKKSHGVEMPCGGRHACGKCMVYAEGSFAAPSGTEQKLLGAERLAQGIRLACFLEAVPDGKIDALRQEADGDETICVSTPSAPPVACAAGISPAQPSEGTGTGTSAEAAPGARLYRHLGAAVDIGTTTIAAVLYREGRAVGTMGAWNPQSVFGADVVSRMEASLEGKADKLAAIVREAVSHLLTELAEHAGERTEAIETVIITGNTSMLYFLTQKDPRCLSRAPFEADELFGWWTTGEALDLSCWKADVYLPRCMSAFVGADITTAILGSGLTETDDVSATHSGRARLMVDVGTNGEIVLFHKERLICCATAAGPAFEGAGLSCGMRGVAGAIDHVSWENGSWKVHVIGDREASTAEGICGSGVIDGVAGLLESGLLEDTGYLEEDVCFAGNVGLTAEDIREVQLAKGAIRAGMETLLAEEKMDAAGLEGLYVAGGFGSYMSAKSAERIGLFPKIDLSRIKICGNAALAGAVKILHNRRMEKEATALAERAKTINLGTNAKFQKFYMEYMMFEE
ncbi:MAG: DUF4445 domain-containing protein [Lachnospiraceae bacterium]|nr:DUF4445 domain-containing protein [Lachnospiraceae bacterium]